MRSPFILQVFATHLNSIAGAVDVPSLQAADLDDYYDDASPAAKYPPKGALALAAAAVCNLSQTYSRLTLASQVERTLQLWAEDNMGPPSAEPIRRKTNKPTIKAVSKLNPQTGLVSSVASKFSADNWGATTRNYMKSIEKMKAGSLERIVELALPFMSPMKSRRGELSGSLSAPADGHEDIRACLEDVRACLEDDWHVFTTSDMSRLLIYAFF
jgi:hypothetical protein